MAVKSPIPCVCAVDLGTSWIKAGVFSRDGELLASESAPSPPVTQWHGMQTFPVATYLDAVFGVLKRLMEQADRDIPRHQLLSLSASTQRATLCLADKHGHAVTPAICWHDTASQTAIEPFSCRIDPTTYRRMSGLPPLFLLSLFKILHLREINSVTVSDSTRFVPLHASLMSSLGAPRFVIDPSNASATGMMDIRTRTWCSDILEAADVSEQQLPDILPAGTVCGHVTPGASAMTGLPAGLPLVVGGGDQQCSALATGCTHAGRAAICLGSVGCLMCYTAQPKTDPEHPLYCMAHVIPDRWIMEGVCGTPGITLDWARETFSVGSHEELVRMVKQSPVGANGARLFSHLAGTGAPDYLPAMGGGFDELRPSHTRADLLRAVTEATCIEVCRAVKAAASHQSLEEVVLTGNVCRNPVVVDILASTLEQRVNVFPGKNASLLGAAILALSVEQPLEKLSARSKPLAKPHLDPHRPRMPKGAYNLIFPAYSRAVSSRIAAAKAAPDNHVPLTSVRLPQSLGREPSELIRKSLDLANVAFYSYTMDGQITFIDRPSLKILDLDTVYSDPSEVVGKNIADLFVYAEPPRSLRQRILSEGAVSGIVYHLKTLSGEDRWTLHDSFLDEDPRTGETIVYAMVRDVTAQHRAEIAVRKSHKKLRFLATRIAEIRERERTRVARDLHDGLGQHLYAIRMLISSIHTGRCGLDCPGAQTLATIDEELGSLLQATRDLIVGLRPPELDSLGLAVALENELERITSPAKIQWTFVREGEDTDPPSVALSTDLFRMAQEALLYWGTPVLRGYPSAISGSRAFSCCRPRPPTPIHR